MARSPYVNQDELEPVQDENLDVQDEVKTKKKSKKEKVEEVAQQPTQEEVVEEKSFLDDEPFEEEKVEEVKADKISAVVEVEEADEDDELFKPTTEEAEVEEEEKETFETQPRDIEVPEGYAEDIDPPQFKRLKIAKVVNDSNRNHVIYALRGTQQSVYAALERMDNALFDKKGSEMNEWWEKVNTARSTTTMRDDQYIDVVTRKGAQWRNMINHGTDEKPLYKGPVNERGLGKSHAGDNTAAFNLLSGMLGLGRPVYACLYHTGIWVKLRAPTAASFIALDEMNAEQKIEYGMRTRGEIFSNDGAIMRKNVANFILDHVITTNAPSDDPEYLKEIIKVEDLNELMRALMQARYPDGYPLIQVCSVNPAECTEAVEGLVDLRTLSWVDTSALTAKQKMIISAPRKRITEEQLREYQEEFKNNGKGKIYLSADGSSGDEMSNGAILNIEMPTLAQEEDYAVAWIKGIEAGLESLFKEKHDPELRRRKLNDIISLNYFKTYGQYVNSVEIIEAGIKVREFTAQDDPDELDQFFELVSGDVRYTERFINELKRYMAENIISVVGILNYECPNCGKKHDTRPGKHHIVLPIDMVTTFFTLVQSSVRASIIRQDT